MWQFRDSYKKFKQSCPCQFFILFFDKVNSVWIKPILLRSCFCRITQCKHGKNFYIFRKIQKSVNFFHVFFYRSNAKPYSTQTKSICFQSDILLGNRHVNLCKRWCNKSFCMIDRYDYCRCPCCTAGVWCYFG